MTHWKKWAAGFGLVLLLIGLLTFWNVYRGFNGGQQIDARQLKHKQHPLFAEAARTGQPIDYFDAINRVAGEGVQPENNFCVAILELVPADGPIPAQRRAEYQNVLPFDEEAQPRFESDTALKERFGPPVVDQVLNSGLDLWQPAAAGNQQCRQVLDSQAQAIAKLRQELERRPRYFMPLLKPKEGPQAVLAVSLEHSQQLRWFARWLIADSDRAMVDGNLLTAWQDIRACYQMAQRVCEGPFLVEWLIGQRLQAMADERLVQLLNQPEIDLALVKLIFQEMPQLETLTPWTHAMDLGERSFLLNSVDLLVNHEIGADYLQQLAGIEAPMIPWGWVDTNQLADQWNDLVDQMLEAEKEEEPIQTEIKLAQIEEQLRSTPAWNWRAARVLIGVSPRQEATDFTSNLLMKMLTPAFQVVHQSSTVNQVARSQIRVALAVRLFERKHGRFPTDVGQLEAELTPDQRLEPYRDQPWTLSISEGTNGQELEIVSRTDEGRLQNVVLITLPK